MTFVAVMNETKQMNCDLSYCSEIFMPFGSLNYNVAFPLLSVSEKKKEKTKQNRIGELEDFYGVEKKPLSPQRTLGCPMMISSALRGSFCLCRQSWLWQVPFSLQRPSAVKGEI